MQDHRLPESRRSQNTTRHRPKWLPITRERAAPYGRDLTVYAAYFEQGRCIGDLEVLADIAGEVGLDRDALRESLLTDAAQEQVLADAQWAQQAGISGVPFFIVNNKYAWSGAQPPEAILQMLKQIDETKS